MDLPNFPSELYHSGWTFFDSGELYLSFEQWKGLIKYCSAYLLALVSKTIYGALAELLFPTLLKVKC